MGDKEPTTEELPLDDVEVTDPALAPATSKRKGPPPLPGRDLEPATSTKPTEPPPPPPPRKPSVPPPPAPAALKSTGMKPPARLGKSVLPPKPAASPKDFQVKAPGQVPKPRRDRSMATTMRLRKSDVPLPGAKPPTPSKPPIKPSATRPSAPPPPSPAAKSVPPAGTKSSRPRPPLTSSRPPLVGTAASRATAPGKTPATKSVGDAARTARLRYVEEELKELKRDVEQRVGAIGKRLDAIEAKTTRRSTEAVEARASLLDQRLDEISEDLDTHRREMTAKLEQLADSVKQILRGPDTLDEDTEAVTKQMTAPPDVVLQLEELRGAMQSHEGAVATQLAAMRSQLDDVDDRSTQPQEVDVASQLAALREELTARFEERLTAAVADAVAKAEAAAVEAAAATAAKIESERPAAKPKSKPKKKKAKEPGLTDVKGIGPASAKKLAAEGVATPGEVAAWSDEDIDRLHEKTGTSRKRLRDWRAAAKKL